NARAWDRAAIGRLAADHKIRRARRRFLRSCHWGKKFVARDRHAIDHIGYHVGAWLLRAWGEGSHRHPISRAAAGVHLGFPPMRPSFGWHLREGRTGA